MLIPTEKQQNNTMTCAVCDVNSHWKTRKQHNDLCCLWCYFPLKNKKATQWLVLFVMLFPTEKQENNTMTSAVCDVISHWKTRKQHNDLCCLWCYFWKTTPGWWFQPLWVIWKSIGKDYSQYMEIHKSHVPNHQPDISLTIITVTTINHY